MLGRIAMHAPGEVIAEKYVLGELLGAGGMGEVYRAAQPSLERSVALKIVRSELAGVAGVRERFWYEAIAAARSVHRNVIPIIDYDGGATPFLVMPFVAGQRLGELARSTGPWPLRRVRRVVKQLLAALVAAHERMIIHGDVKSDNVLVAREDARDHATLIDFGLARLPDHPRLDCDAIVSGTPEYLAPEIIEGAPPTAASDLYSVGIILYELVAGFTPFGGGDPPTVLARQLAEPPPPLADACPGRGIPRDLDRLVMRALDKDPRARMAHATAFRAALATIPMREVASPTLDLDDGLPADDGDGIVVACLEHVRSLVDRHRLRAAVGELENAIRSLTSRGDTEQPPDALWRLELTLAALYDGIGKREDARALARAGAASSRRAGSLVGVARARTLVERLARRSTRGGPAQ